MPSKPLVAINVLVSRARRAAYRREAKRRGITLSALLRQGADAMLPAEEAERLVEVRRGRPRKERGND